MRRASGEGDEGRYSAADLARLAGVRLPLVRRWMSAGLLPLVRGPRRELGFKDLTRARELARLHGGGWTAARIAAALQAARPLLDDDDALLSGLETEASRGDVLVRMPDGRRCTATGQGLLAFGESTRAAGVRELRSPHDWFAWAIEAESAGRLDDAITGYERAVPGAGVEAWFNLGNCRYERGDAAGAARAFAAAVELEPDYAEAWNNLGIARSALHQHEDAVAALRRALTIRPHYADAHYNLADALATIGDLAAARAHWRSYLGYDPNSRWAEQVRRRLLGADGDAS